MLSSYSLWSVFTALLAIAGWAFNSLRKKYMKQLILPDGSPTVDEFVTRPMLAMARTCATLCQRVYDRQENLRKHLRIKGWQCDDVITSNDLSAVCGIVYRDGQAIVVWRGTNVWNRDQVKANSKAKLLPLLLNLPPRNGGPWLNQTALPGLIHAGVYAMFRQTSALLIPAILRHLRAGRKVYVTGHSQGGALAAVTVAMMRAVARLHSNSDFAAAGLITFGSMRPGNAAFCEFVNDGIGYDPTHGDFGIQRYRNNNDIVPLVPLFSCGYRHAGAELYIWPASMITKNPAWPLKLVQHLKPLAEGVIGDGFADHSMGEYVRHIQAVRIGDA